MGFGLGLRLSHVSFSLNGARDYGKAKLFAKLRFCLDLNVGKGYKWNCSIELFRIGVLFCIFSPAGSPARGFLFSGFSYVLDSRFLLFSGLRVFLTTIVAFCANLVQ